MLLEIIKNVTDKVGKDLEKVQGLLPEDKKKAIRDLAVKAAIAYGEALIEKEIKKNG